MIADANVCVAFRRRAGGHLLDGVRAVAGDSVSMQFAPNVGHRYQNGQFAPPREIHFVAAFAQLRLDKTQS